MAALFVWQPHVYGEAGMVTPDFILGGARLEDGTLVGAERLGSAPELTPATGERLEPALAAVSAHYGTLVAPALVVRSRGGDVVSVQIGRQAWRPGDRALQWDEGGTAVLPTPENGIATMLGAPSGHRRAALRDEGGTVLAYDPVLTAVVDTPGNR